jgi:hypothetical protein
MNPRVVHLAVVFLLLLVTLAACQTTKSPPTTDVTGIWIGNCSGCVATYFALHLKQSENELIGTLQINNTNNYGDDTKPLKLGSISGNQVFFRTVGDDGRSFNVNLLVDESGKLMNGTGDYGATFSLEFRRETN